MNYKVSLYNIFFENKQHKYVYNTLSTSLVELEDSLFKALKFNNVYNIPQRYISGLVEQNILVNQDDNEVEHYLEYFDSVRNSFAQVLDITILPTYACNLNCVYCMQGRKKESDAVFQEKTIMSEELADSILHFIDNQLESNKIIRKVNCGFYGGEPLLGFHICKKIADGVDVISKKHGVNVTYQMTTNLTLVTPDVIDFFKKYKPGIQVSIDGNREIHNKKRIYPNGCGTYDLIISNLKKICDEGLKDIITIRMNIDIDSWRVADEALSAIETYSNDIYMGELKNFDECNDSYTTAIQEDNDKEISRKFIQNTYIKHNIPIPATFGKKSPCSIIAPNKYYIDCYGNAYKCELLVNLRNLSCGKIENDGMLHWTEEYKKQISWTPKNSKKCLICKLLPLCGGGCPALKAKATKNATAFYCTETEKELINYLCLWIDSNSNESQ